MKSESTSRRSLLKATVAVASTAAVPALAAVAPDPIYAAIEKHRRAYQAHGDALDACSNYGLDNDDCPTWRALERAATAACDADCEAQRELVEVGATTREGWAALLRYEDEFRRGGSEFVDLATGEKWRMGLMRKLAAFLDGMPEWPPILDRYHPYYRSEKEGAWLGMASLLSGLIHLLRQATPSNKPLQADEARGPAQNLDRFLGPRRSVLAFTINGLAAERPGR